MAVYTDVAAEDLAEFLKGYDIGELLSYKGIAEGVENSNFLLHTSKGAYILTLYEKRVAVDDLPYFLSLMAHLAERGVSCPQPAKNRQGAVLQPARRPAGGDHQFPRRHVAAAAERRALRRRRRGARQDASGGRRLSACPRKIRCRSQAGGRCSIWPRRAPTACSRACAISSRANSIISKRAGPPICRSASSTPICFPTTCSSSATSCRA